MYNSFEGVPVHFKEIFRKKNFANKNNITKSLIDQCLKGQSSEIDI